MLGNAEHAVALMEGRSLADLHDDPELCFVLQCLLEKMSEAAAGVSEPTRGRLAAIKWREVLALRGRIAPDEDRVDHELLWQTVSGELPELIQRLLIFPLFKQA
jgi:uncharacterized protein with HEPN domain